MNTACQRKWPCESWGTQQEHEEELKYFILTALFFTSEEDQTSAESQGQILVHEWGPGCGAGRVYGLTETIRRYVPGVKGKYYILNFCVWW